MQVASMGGNEGSVKKKRAEVKTTIAASDESADAHTHRWTVTGSSILRILVCGTKSGTTDLEHYQDPSA